MTEPTVSDADFGLMKVSLERGLFKRIDGHRVARGAHYTEQDCWLTESVKEFLAQQVERAGIRSIVDPFAGAGHMLEAAVAEFPQLRHHGFDITGGRWPENDSLIRIPKVPDAIICTNPPYLARFSAKRKGVLSAVQRYFEDSRFSDLYQIALERMLSLGQPVIAIIPETFILSGHFRESLHRVIVLEERNPFLETDTPVCVACFSPSEPRVRCRVYKDETSVGWLDDLLSAGDLGISPLPPRCIKFNVAEGSIALKAVDGTDPDDRIRFGRGESFLYRTDMIKHSSRLMTRISVDGLARRDVDAVVERANALTENIRGRSADVLLSPFKGNNKSGQRRRRLDYALARAVLTKALSDAGITGDRFEQAALF